MGIKMGSYLWKKPRRDPWEIRTRQCAGSGFWRDEKERRRSSQVRRLREYPIHRCAVPLPKWGRLRYEDTAIPETTPSLMGKAKRRRLRHPKRKPTPPRCTRQPLPREGARVDTPSFLWKEVPRRGGGWMGKAVFPKQSLPRVGKVASKASRIGFCRYEKERGDRLRSTIHESILYKKQLIKPIYSYKKRKSNAVNDFNVIYCSGCR